jgi:predicted ATP-dependent serine protease
MEYQALNFTGRWRDFYGQPSVNFHCAIHGMAGQGKSTFAIQFANYLAENFGEVIYISGEEGFSKTMKDKFRNNNTASEHLFLANLCSYQDILNEIKPNIYNFIFIDSLDNMRINAQELKELRKLFINSALITIYQSTKDGKMRGSYEIVHDSDIAVAVSDGVAETVKNRFEEKGRQLKIFSSENRKGMSFRNIILD